MAFQKFGHMIEKLLPLTTSGTPLNLVFNSPTFHRFTGTLAQTVVLPDATTMALYQEFTIYNRSSAAITVNKNGGALLDTIAAGDQRTYELTDKSVAAGTWDISNEASSGGGGGGSASLTAAQQVALLAAAALGNFEDAQTITKAPEYNPYEFGGDYWLSRYALPTPISWPMATTLNGHGYVAGGATDGGPQLPTYRFMDTENYVLPRANLLTAREGAAASFTLGGFWHVAGGNNALQSHHRYTDSTDSWANITNMPALRRNAASFVACGFPFVVGGVDGGGTMVQDISIYNEATLTWHYRAASPTALVNSSGAISLDDYGFLFGGSDVGATTHSNTRHRYNVAVNAWRSLPYTLAQQKGQLQGCWTANGIGFIPGGVINGPSQTAEVEDFYPETSFGIFRTSMPTAKYAMGPWSLNGSGYVAGARTLAPSRENTIIRHRGFGWLRLDFAKIMSSTPTAITVAAAMRRLSPDVAVALRSDGGDWQLLTANQDSALRLGDKLLDRFRPIGKPFVAGSFNTTNSSIYEYGEDTNTWRQNSGPTTQRGNGQGGWNINGFGFMVGGWQGSYVSNLDRYNVDLHIWLARANTPIAKSGGRAWVLDGLGWWMGGFNGPTAVNDGSRYDPDANSWTNGYSLLTAMGEGGGSLMEGHGYVAGGASASGVPLNQCQRFSPVTTAWLNRTGNGGSTYNSSGLTLDHRMYVTGGNFPGNTGFTQYYDNQLDSWTSRASNPNTGTAGASGVFELRGLGFICGINGGTACSAYNPHANTWNTSITALPNTQNAGLGGQFQPGFERRWEMMVGLAKFDFIRSSGSWILRAPATTVQFFDSTFSVGEQFWGIVGLDGGLVDASTRTYATQRYDNTLDSWLRRKDYPGGAGDTGGHSNSTGMLGHGYTIGFNTAGGSLTPTSYKYNPESDAFVSILNLPVNSGAGNLVAALKMFMYNNGNHPSIGGTLMHRYNPHDNSWASRTSSTSDHYGGNSAVVQGYWYSAAGNGGGTLHERYDDVNNSWLSRSTLLFTRSSYGGILSFPDEYWLVGGWNGAPYANTESYDHNRNFWMVRHNYPAAIHGVGTAMLQADKGFAAGGSNGASYVADTYVLQRSMLNVLLGAGLKVTS